MFVTKVDVFANLKKPPAAGMRELRERVPALWSLTKRSLDDPFFGTVNTGCAVIPARREGPNEGEYRSSITSSSLWCRKKEIDSSSRFGGPERRSTVPSGWSAGSPILAKGQKPTRRP